jgi:hypothetical protein
MQGLRIAGLAAAAAFLAGSCGLAIAQERTSTNDRMTHAVPGRGEAAQTDPLFRRTLACVLIREPRKPRNLVDTVPGSREEARLFGAFQSRLEQCYVGTVHGISFSWELLRGGFAEIYYHREFPAGLPGAPADTAWAAAWTRPRVIDRRVSQVEMLHATMRCVTVRRPEAVGRMLAAAPLSAEEASAVRTLRDDLSACLNSGVQLTASRQSLRGLLAEAALHYGEAIRNGPPAPQPDQDPAAH